MDHMMVPLSMLFGFVAIFLILLHLLGKLGDKKIDGLIRRLNAVEKDLANMDIKSREIFSEIEEIKKKNLAYVQLFKTVVHGFDYIVQGTKSALGMEDTVGLEQKVVSSVPRQEIPEGEGEE